MTPEFQQYLRDCAAGIPRKKGSAPHKQHGARAALDALLPLLGENMAPVAASVLHGHHGGIRNREEMADNIASKGVTPEMAAALRVTAHGIDARLDPPVPDPAVLFPAWATRDALACEMFLRFVFSALVDADALDTEAHNDPASAARRVSVPVTINALCDTLRTRQEEFAEATGTVNDVRRAVYEHCVRAGKEYAPGVFSLSVPTGGGKTRSSLAFALEHAAARGLRRVIYAIPYTSIVDQTAETFRTVFTLTPDAVLEHHSAIDTRKRQQEDADGGDDAEQWRRLAAQNWDAPLVVTTTVQLFESLFSNRPAACRKLHRLAGSVIVLDEVQTLPPTLLAPLLSGLRALTEHYGASVVLCTATQPELALQTEHVQGFPIITPIVPEAEARQHFQQLKRVRFRVETDAWDWPQVAAEMDRDTRQALCVVNTRRQALSLLDALDPDGDNEDVLHLSTLLCGAHRRKVLADVRLRLKNGRPILLASTQTIEAGVDVDFPKVLRALGPLDRIIQAAGRCNREGLRPRDESMVVVFRPADDKSPPGVYRQAVEQTVRMFLQAQARGEDVDFDDPQVITDYFARLYADMEQNVDRHGVQLSRADFHYPDVARKVRLIDEDTVSVFITNYKPYQEEAAAILERANKTGRMTRELWQRAQPLCVSIRATDAGPAHVRETPFGLNIWDGHYHPKRGLDLPDAPGEGVVRDPHSLMA